MPDIVDAAVASGKFNTLVAAVKAAGLVDTLKSKGPFTVFAPIDEAFSKLPPGTVEALLKDIPKLKSILTYHVVPGKHLFVDLKKMTEVTTVQGQKIKIDAKKGALRVNDAQVIQADIIVDNGVCHAIDKVILPK
ncbi:MAG: fasciclin domain-containing protein [Candidatus Methanomethylicia archaeon]|nr:fasciclin domain-containing protein [Candidatus Methanomethylicia archaeon]